MVQTKARHKLRRFASELSLSGGHKLRSRIWTKLVGWRDTIRKMAGDPIKSTESYMDLHFQSLAAKELNNKQMELDSATAKLDQLKRELETRRESGQPRKAENLEIPQNPNPTISPSLTRRSVPPQPPPTFGPAPTLLTHRPRPQESMGPIVAPLSVSSKHSVPSPPITRRSLASETFDSYVPPTTLGSSSSLISHRPRPLESSLSAPMLPPLSISSSHPVPSPPLIRRSATSDNFDSYHTSSSSSSRGSRGLPLSPRLPYYERGPRSLSSSTFDYARTGTPSLDGSSAGMYTDRVPSQRPPLSFEGPQGFAPVRFSDDVTSLRRRPAQRSWNESDLDMSYDKKAPPERVERAPISAVPLVKAWRESSLDQAPAKGKGDVSATLPRGYKFSAGAERGPQLPDSGWRSASGSLPRPLPPQQPISRIPVPPPVGKVQPHRPLPLSMIFHLQNAFWEHQAPPPAQTMPYFYATPAMTTNLPPAVPVVQDMPIPSTNAVAPPSTEEVPRPLSPTRLQPNLPPSLADVQRVLEDIPRPLRRRGSQEHTAQASSFPSHRRQYQQIMSRLFGRATPKTSTVSEQLKMEEKLQGSSSKQGPAPAEQTSEESHPSLVFQINPIPEDVKAEEKLEEITNKPASTPEDPVCVIMEVESRVGATVPVPTDYEFRIPLVISESPTTGLRSALKGRGSPLKSRPRRARLDPLILLLDAALTGEQDVVTQALKEVSDPSQPNEEGITALHNAICGANYNIVSLLISSGANVNAADSHGWTPLHCAASCNDQKICNILVRHGAAIFATTHSDGSLPVDKCDPYREGYKECLTYLTEVEHCMGETQSGVVYAVWDYTAEFADELSLKEGDSVTVLRKDGENGTWWWASLCGREGYVPRNYFGMYPRVQPQRSSP
ncbi:relA-associated inhibitor isoform X1 [Pelobates fuscus]|uniref:relA-associated inhibitor isoform X1 n=2 Tax=Pelobates fuscus TaxID=191477 RepID=UPI002FE42D5B